MQTSTPTGCADLKVDGDASVACSRSDVGGRRRRDVVKRVHSAGRERGGRALAVRAPKALRPVVHGERWDTQPGDRWNVPSVSQLVWHLAGVKHVAMKHVNLLIERHLAQQRLRSLGWRLCIGKERPGTETGEPWDAHGHHRLQEVKKNESLMAVMLSQRGFWSRQTGLLCHCQS